MTAQAGIATAYRTRAVAYQFPGDRYGRAIAAGALPVDNVRRQPGWGPKPLSDRTIAEVVRIADREHGSLLGALDLDWDDAADPDHHDPLTIPNRMEPLT